MIKAIRRMLGVAPLDDSTRDRMMAIALAALTEKGWEWKEPVRITRHRGSCRVWTNADSRGGNAYVYIDIETGSVTKIGATGR